MGHMMDGMMNGGAMWGMGLIGILVLVLLVLGVAALIKYLFFAVALAAMAGTGLVSSAAAQQPDARRGAQAFRACAACHSLEPNKNMTGPSLAGVFGRQAGSLPSFDRYSAALKSAHVTWDAKSLGAWIADPARFIPGNHMTFPGIKDDRTRSDLIAFLQSATAPGATPPATAQRGGMGGMMGGGTMGGTGGMMRGGAVRSLKQLTPDERVTAIRHCRDSYHVATADGQTHDFWDRNLRLKTDASDDGPAKGSPALLPAGMMGDRADVIFAAPEEISGAIKDKCK